MVWHGYASSTPCVDASGVYVFFSAEGLFAFDHHGGQRWRQQLGDGVHRWGAGSSPVLQGDTLFVNASIESETLYAINKHSGGILWSRDGIEDTYAVPVVRSRGDGEAEVLLSQKNQLVAYNTRTGQIAWQASGIRGYIALTPVLGDGLIFLIG
ncbi:MAG: PQQ-binding-like beta-propeller repeat protein [Opitutales bacterium]